MVAAVSGTTIDVNTLVSQLMAAERAPLTAMQKSASGYKTQISAFGQLRSSLSGLSDALSALSSGSTFSAARASVSDPAVLGASAANGASGGTYNVEVQALAQAQKLSSSAFAAADSVVGTGTLTIQLGSFAAGAFTANAAKSALNLTVDASNNTLAGIRDAINGANAGVRASIINDGSGYRLAIASLDGGTANGMRISTADGDGSNTNLTGLSQLAYDPAAAAGSGKNLAQNAAAVDALLYIDGVKVVKSTNSIADAIDGVTLNLAKTNTGSTVAVTVGPDGAAMKSALDAFVKAYNSFNSTVHSLTYYDATNKSAGTLQGDATVRGILGQVRNQLTGVIAGLSGTFTRLPQIGLTLQSDGSLALDSSKFQAALDSHPGDLKALFATTGQSSDTRVQFQGASATLASGSYSVAITQAATRGLLTGASPAGLTISAGLNDTLTLSVDGKSANVTLGTGTYASADALAAEVQSRLNGDSTLKANGISVSVSQSGGTLSVTSASYGSISTVTGAGGLAAATLFGLSPASVAGTNVAGTINGAAATGSGQSLVSAGGLRLSVTAQSTGSLGNLTFTRGYGSLLSSAVTQMMDSAGPLSTRTDGLNASVKRNTRQQDDFNSRMTALEAQYRRQYSALDAMLSNMSTTSNYLTQQLAALNNNR